MKTTTSTTAMHAAASMPAAAAEKGATSRSQNKLLHMLPESKVNPCATEPAFAAAAEAAACALLHTSYKSIMHSQSQTATYTLHYNVST
jgi:hypothetical protein